MDDRDAAPGDAPNLPVPERRAEILPEAALEHSHEQQREAAESLQLLVEGAAQGILSVDAQGSILSVNTALLAMFGWERTALLGQPLDSLIPPAVRGKHSAHVAGYSAAPRSRPMGVGLSLLAQRKDGTTFPVEVSLSHVATAAGGRTVAFVTDITTRKRVEDELRQSERRLRLALDAAEAGAWMWDVESDQIHGDERVSRRMGVPPAQPFSVDRFLASVYPADRKGLRDIVETVRRPDGPDGWNFEYRLTRPDGQLVWYQSLGQAERVDGRTVRVFGLTLDIDARKKSEAELHRSHAALRSDAVELDHRATQLRRLALDLTLTEHRTREGLAKTLHDGLQQLLFSAMLKVDRAAKGMKRPDDLDAARAALQEAIAAARSVSVELAPPVLKHGTLLQACEWLAESKKRKYGLTVSVHADPAAEAPDEDVRLLVFESVRELLFNVVKHAKTDQASLDIGVDARGLRIVVSDVGVGFDMDQSFDPGEAHDGGLGLFSIRERLELLGGALLVDSAPGHGARFTLVVPQTFSPAASGHDAGGRGNAPGPDQSEPRADGAWSLRILIADDHAVVREGLRELLAERSEFDVVGEAVDGQDAVDQATALRPDVVVMDITMPRMDGVEATRRIRAVLPSVQIFGLSTHEEIEGLRAIKDAGAAGYFTKGDGVHKLIERLLRVRTHGTNPTSLG